MDTPTLEEQNAALRSLLKEFRDFVLSAVRMWSAKHVDPSHVNPIWARVAEAIEPPAAPAPKTGKELPITATIKEAYVMQSVIYGKMYGDTRGRFPDGAEIHSSRVFGRLPNGDYITRSGSVYRVEFLPQAKIYFEDLKHLTYEDAEVLLWQTGRSVC